MKTKRSKVVDSDLSGAGKALERAAARARRLAEETTTPFYVLKSGRIVDLNAQATSAYVLRKGGSRK
jgi:hypothetical protein